MTDNPKIRYEIALAPHQGHDEPVGFATRNVVASDRDALAGLMLDAYVGTIDYEGETISEALDEVDQWFAGPSLLEHSYVAVVDDHLVAAILAMSVDATPFIAIVMTEAASKNAGFGRAVTERSLSSMANTDHDHAVLYITAGNAPSERLFASLGAVATPSE
jgi:hypothetical protein